MVGALGVVTVVALLLTRVWVNVVASIAIGVAVVCLHALFRGTEDLVTDDQDSPYGTLLSDDPQGNYTII